MRKLLCIETYEEDLTGFDDFAVVWQEGKIYDAVHHDDMTYTVKTEQNKKGIIGEFPYKNGYACNYETHFVDMQIITLLDAVRYAFKKGYFTIENNDNYGCEGIHCEAHGVNANGFYFDSRCESEDPKDYVTEGRAYGTCMEITNTLKWFAEDDVLADEALGYLLDIKSLCVANNIDAFDSVLDEWIDKANSVLERYTDKEI